MFAIPRSVEAIRKISQMALPHWSSSSRGEAPRKAPRCSPPSAIFALPMSNAPSQTAYSSAHSSCPSCSPNERMRPPMRRSTTAFDEFPMEYTHKQFFQPTPRNCVPQLLCFRHTILLRAYAVQNKISPEHENPPTPLMTLGETSSLCWSNRGSVGVIFLGRP